MFLQGYTLPFVGAISNLDLIVYGAAIAATITLVIHWYREIRATATIVATASEVLWTLAPYIAIFFVTAVVGWIQSDASKIGVQLNLQFIQEFTDNMTSTVYKLMVASGMCLANIKLTPVANVYYDEANAKISPFNPVLGTAFTTAKVFTPSVQILVAISIIFLYLGPVMYLFPYTRRIGALMIGFALAEVLGLSIYTYSVIGALKDIIGEVNIDGNKVTLSSDVCGRHTFEAAPISAVSTHCDDVIRRFMLCQIDVYAAYTAWTDTYLILMGLIVPVATGILARH